MQRKYDKALNMNIKYPETADEMMTFAKELLKNDVIREIFFKHNNDAKEIYEKYEGDLTKLDFEYCDNFLMTQKKDVLLLKRPQTFAREDIIKKIFPHLAEEIEALKAKDLERNEEQNLDEGMPLQSKLLYTLDIAINKIMPGQYTGIDEIKKIIVSKKDNDDDAAKWNEIIQICKARLQERFVIRDPEIALLYRAIAQFDDNIDMSHQLSNIKELLMAQEKRDFIEGYIEKERKRLKYSSPSNINEQGKVDAYLYLENEIKNSDATVQLKFIIDDNSSVMKSIIFNTNKSYMLNYVPHASIRDMLGYNRGFDIKTATSQKKLNAYRNKLKKKFRILNIKYPKKQYQPLNQEAAPERFNTEREKEFLQNALAKNPNQTVFRFGNNFLMCMRSQSFPGELRIHVTRELSQDKVNNFMRDYLSNENDTRRAAFHGFVDHTWKIDINGNWFFHKRKKELYAKGGRDIDPKSNFEKESKISENILVQEKVHHLKMKPLISDVKNRAYVSIMRTVPGITLEEFMDKVAKREKLLPKNSRLILAIAVLRAVQEQVHNLDIVDLDLKMANIMVRFPVINGVEDITKPIVTIIDFDQSLKEGEILTHVVGTKGYMAPELAKFTEENYKDNLTVNKKIDVFSCGEVIWKILSGTSIVPAFDLTLGKRLANAKVEDQANIIKEGMEYIRGIKKNDNVYDDFLIQLIEKNFEINSDDRPTLQEFTNGLVASRFEEMKNENNSDEIENIRLAHDIAIATREQLTNRNFCSNLDDMKTIILESLNALNSILNKSTSEKNKIKAEYLRNLGIYCLLDCQSPDQDDIFIKVNNIFENFQAFNNINNPYELIGYKKFAIRYEKIFSKSFTLDDMFELNLKNEKTRELLATAEESITIIEPRLLEITGKDFSTLKKEAVANLQNSNLSQDEITFYQAILKLESYITKEGARFDSLNELIIYHQKKTMMNKCEKELIKSTSTKEKNAYRELLYFMKDSLMEKNTTLYAAFKSKRYDDNNFARFFIKDKSTNSIFSRFFSKNIISKIRKLHTPEAIILQLSQKNIGSSII